MTPIEVYKTSICLPNIPALVIIINTITATIKYVFKNSWDFCQYLYRKLVATNLPISNELAIIIAAIEEPLNNIPIPIMLKNAAQLAMNNDDKPTIFSNVN